MHPAEALHGDLGMLTNDDTLLAISNSGESEEILKIIPAIKKRDIKLIAMSGNLNSTLAKQADFVLGLCGCFGRAIMLDEKYFSVFTAVAGSAPAFAYLRDILWLHGDKHIFSRGSDLGSGQARLNSELRRE